MNKTDQEVKVELDLKEEKWCSLNRKASYYTQVMRPTPASAVWEQ